MNDSNQDDIVIDSHKTVDGLQILNCTVRTDIIGYGNEHHFECVYSTKSGAVAVFPIGAYLGDPQTIRRIDTRVSRVLDRDGRAESAWAHTAAVVAIRSYLGWPAATGPTL